eukprot:13004735-Alexandrium_andersonii.AAC.1
MSVHSGDVESSSCWNREARGKAMLFLARIRAPRDLAKDQTLFDAQRSDILGKAAPPPEPPHQDRPKK